MSQGWFLYSIDIVAVHVPTNSGIVVFTVTVRVPELSVKIFFVNADPEISVYFN